MKSLEEQGIQHLKFDTETSPKSQLFKIHSSIIFNFLDLVLILANDPTNDFRVEKLNHLSILFVNFHHLINEYRPYQALESLVQQIESKIKENREKAVELNEMAAKLEEGLQKIDYET